MKKENKNLQIANKKKCYETDHSLITYCSLKLTVVFKISTRLEPIGILSSMVQELMCHFSSQTESYELIVDVKVCVIAFSHGTIKKMICLYK